MLVYILRRIAMSLTVIFAAVMLTFVVFLKGPTDIAEAYCPGNERRQCTEERLTDIRRALGIDQPLLNQMGEYLKGMVVGRDIKFGSLEERCSFPCLGYSFKDRTPVTRKVAQAFPVTLSLVVGGVVVYVTLALVFGVTAARFRGRAPDRLIVGVSQFLTAIPYYVAALMFYLTTMIYTKTLPKSGWYAPSEAGIGKWFTGLLAVWIFYGLWASFGYVRYIRSSMIDVQSQDYVRTARAKGLTERTVLFKHALRAAIAPFVTLVGMGIAGELTGAIFTETIFDLPGMGKLGITAVNNNDLPTLAGLVVVTSVLVSAGNLIVDILYGVVDPRVKLS